MTIEVNPERTAQLADELTALWEASVRASHDFLSDADIVGLRPTVRVGIECVETLVIAYKGGYSVGFLGIEEDKVEMLFVASDHFGEGIGRELITWASNRFGVRRVDVNEQNPQATRFYNRMGFEVFDRADFDEQGNQFPILKLKLRNTINRKR